MDCTAGLVVVLGRQNIIFLLLRRCWWCWKVNIVDVLGAEIIVSHPDESKRIHECMHGLSVHLRVLAYDLKKCHPDLNTDQTDPHIVRVPGSHTGIMSSTPTLLPKFTCVETTSLNCWEVDDNIHCLHTHKLSFQNPTSACACDFTLQSITTLLCSCFCEENFPHIRLTVAASSRPWLWRRPHTKPCKA